jgi:abortive infection bacteriophage resistance protein
MEPKSLKFEEQLELFRQRGMIIKDTDIIKKISVIIDRRSLLIRFLKLLRYMER